MKNIFKSKCTYKLTENQFMFLQGGAMMMGFGGVVLAFTVAQMLDGSVSVVNFGIAFPIVILCLGVAVSIWPLYKMYKSREEIV